MYKDINKFYKYLGIYKPTDITTPKVVKITQHSLPNYVIFHYGNPDKTYPSTGTDFLTNIKNGLIYNVLTYSKLIYPARLLNFSENKIVSKLGKQHNTIPTIPSYRLNIFLRSKFKKLKDEVLVYNYEFINDEYRYTEKPDVLRQKFVNKYTTMFDNINTIENEFNIKGHKKAQFVTVDLPDVLYGMNIIKKYMVKDSNGVDFLKVFYNEKYMLLLELYRLVNEDTYEDSLFHSLRFSDETILILRFKENSIFLKLSTLLSFTKFSSYESDKTFNNETMLNIIFNLTHTLIRSHLEVTEDEIVKNISKQLTNESEDEHMAVVMKAVKDNLTSDDLDTPVTEEEVIVSKINEETKLKDSDVIEVVEVKSIHNDKAIDDFYVNKVDDTVEVLEEMVNKGEIDKKKLLTLKKHMSSFLDKKSPYDNSKTIREETAIPKDDLLIADGEDSLVNMPRVVTNKEEAKFTLKVINEKYIKKVLHKDVIKTLLNLQKSGLIIKDITIDKTEDILGSSSNYIINISDKGKSSYSVKLPIPTIYPDGTYKISGNHYVLKKQRLAIPILKINHTTVKLTSASGKIDIVKAPMKKYDAGYKLRRELNKLVTGETINTLLFGTFNFEDKQLPNTYFLFARYVKSFNYKDFKFTFNYDKRKTVLKDGDDITKIENNKYVVVGKKGNSIIVMDFNNDMFIYKDNKYTNIGSLLTMLDIDKDNITEYSFVKIFKLLVPSGLILSYYLGLFNLLRILKIEYEVLDGSKRINVDNGTVVKFKDKTLVMYYTNDTQRMVMDGLTDKPKVLKEIPLDIMNDKVRFLTIFKQYDYNLITITKIKVLEHMFVDSVTKDILEELKEPTTFTGLIIRGSDMLTTDSFEDPTGVDKTLIKGYERIPQYIHKVFLDALMKKTSEEYFGRSKLNIKPNAVWSMLNEDSAGELVDDLNPMATLKQKSDVTYLGTGGLSKETMVGHTRAYNVKDIGTISEAVKDNSDVGITSYMSANPILKNLRGLGVVKDAKDLDMSNIFSDNTMVTPFLTTDDPKRINYSNIQSSHVIPVDNPRVFPVRTPYQSLIGYKLDRNFIRYADEDGVVTKVEEHSVTIKFKNKGLEVIEFKDWTSKEESGTTFTHKMVTSLKAKDKIKAGNVIYYDKGFFEIDMFDKHTVVYRTGTFVYTAMYESEDTREDAFMLSKGMSIKTSVSTVKVKDITLKETDNIAQVIKIGEYVEADSPLFTIVGDLVGDDKIDEKTLDLLQGFVKDSPKAGYRGKIIKVMVYYNGDIKDMTNSLKTLVKTSKDYMVDIVTGKMYPGKVNSSYSINGKPLDVGSLHIKYYIETKSSMTTADKGVVSAQLKTTMTNIMDNKLTDEHGNEIDIKFSYSGIYNRITPSSDLNSSTATVLKIGTDIVVDMFFNKTKK